MRRVRNPELIDEHDAPLERVADSLRDLARLNRYLGGAATIAHQIPRLLDGERWNRLRMLDVGAGGADILVTLDGWLAARGVRVDGVALDRGPAATRIAAEWLKRYDTRGGPRVVRGDALTLPFADRSFDIVYCSTFMHHFEPEDAARLLGEMNRVSAVGCVVADLRRSRVAHAAARVLAHTVWRAHPCTRHDGPVSVRASYTPAEARELAERAGLKAVVESQPFFRLALRWRRS